MSNMKIFKKTFINIMIFLNYNIPTFLIKIYHYTNILYSPGCYILTFIHHNSILDNQIYIFVNDS